MDRITGFAEENFFDATRLAGWVNADGTLKPYTRLQYENGEVVSEEKIGQAVLRVDLKVHCYQREGDSDASLDFALAYVDKRADGSYTFFYYRLSAGITVYGIRNP